MSYCVIDVGHSTGTLATWINADHPEHTVCDHHKRQYENAFASYNITWWPILRNGEIDEQNRIERRALHGEDSSIS